MRLRFLRLLIRNQRFVCITVHLSHNSRKLHYHAFSIPNKCMFNYDGDYNCKTKTTARRESTRISLKAWVGRFENTPRSCHITHTRVNYIFQIFNSTVFFEKSFNSYTRGTDAVKKLEFRVQEIVGYNSYLNMQPMIYQVNTPTVNNNRNND